jgi:hypothetical protein
LLSRTGERPLMMSTPHETVPIFPEIHVHTDSDNPYALVAAVRLALRQADVDLGDIARFTEEALGDGDAETSRHVCRSWVEVDEPET